MINPQGLINQGVLDKLLINQFENDQKIFPYKIRLL